MGGSPSGREEDPPPTDSPPSSILTCQGPQKKQGVEGMLSPMGEGRGGSLGLQSGSLRVQKKTARKHPVCTYLTREDRGKKGQRGGAAGVAVVRRLFVAPPGVGGRLPAAQSTLWGNQRNDEIRT